MLYSHPAVQPEEQHMNLEILKGMQNDSRTFVAFNGNADLLKEGSEFRTVLGTLLRFNDLDCLIVPDESTIDRITEKLGRRPNCFLVGDPYIADFPSFIGYDDGEVPRVFRFHNGRTTCSDAAARAVWDKYLNAA